MCGIAGEIAFNGRTASQEAVLEMMGEMTSRGPDGRGTWHAGWVALGHQRLSIIDLSSAGAQPMLEEGGLAVTFNGCIYNYKELRRELEPDFTFRSTSDTEVILKAYRKWGDDFVHHLVGMFAIALFDARRGEVLLVRDRLGIKPLYVAEIPGRLRFASSLPALVASGGIDTSVDEVALHHYLSWHSIVPAPRTILRGIRKVPAATIRTVSPDGSWHDREYWKPSYTRRAEHAGWSALDWQDAVREALRTAVRRRMVADVPVGVLLSGGLDSSLLVALLAEEGQHGLSTFSIGFDGAGGDSGNEFEYSDLVAREFGTRHERLHVSTAEFAPSIGDAVGAMSEPMSSHDVTAFHLLSRTVTEHLKVVQCGQGADEVFGGYGYHQPLAGAERSQALPTFTSSFVDHSHDELVGILEPEWFTGSDVSSRVLSSHLDAPGADTALDAVLRLDTHLLMVDDPVKRLDNMSMAWGLEARVPFLDHELVELAASCPPELKASQGGKGILKDLGRQMLPTAVVDRPKGYFPVPALRHLEEPFISMVSDALHAPEAKQRGIFRADYIASLLADPNMQRTAVNSNVLWQFALLEMWLQRHGVG
ncbi:asparagine synthase, glutamine-hydrolyzing [Pseudarthrobacter phenanthrenivorans Sphe3]|uniref:asparagine synthase (glutamine-hydrolyzing) n=1 Tax=Pseudarthrobacter phenanthrenivorans (strain DSM 18606 / JCM 16027 / LMG 23796 / Sphe3) TaxID=930171 RepID=F0MBU5_PSEPM|nr:N-acetylglutaminylglutamine amidotransferase [Pseudarthrobacter phenanthrenivorans]ADX74086.1 asparagine synthase, glutamine-hydrolyzing [Pseudarthrobacter phenanthrenivorans Sphe3]